MKKSHLATILSVGNLRCYKHIVASLLLFAPLVTNAADYCTNPSEYTVDKRCYVTDEQKKFTPYNAVVALMYDGEVSCTGFIVRGKDGKTPYLYTAKHCTDNNGDGLSDAKLSVQLQDGRIVEAYKKEVGSYISVEMPIKSDDKSDDQEVEYEKVEKNLLGDWAVYSFKESDLPMLDKSTKILTAEPEALYDAKVIGCGALKILSDKEIQRIKNDYAKYLRRIGVSDVEWKQNAKLGFEAIGMDWDEFKVFKYKYFLIEEDADKLKVSECQYTSDGHTVGCQSWGGNSGGPVVDDENAVMAMIRAGTYYIGGEEHAGNKDKDIMIGYDTIVVGMTTEEDVSQ